MDSVYPMVYLIAVAAVVAIAIAPGMCRSSSGDTFAITDAK